MRLLGVEKIEELGMRHVSPILALCESVVWRSDIAKGKYTRIRSADL